MLLLFDIDGTLISTGGAGMRSMLAAGREVFGPTFSADGIEFAGRLDPLIIADMLRASGISASESQHAAFIGAYRAELARTLASVSRRANPGVMELLDTLAPLHGTMGVLTGNFRETGEMKLESCGIDPGRFAIRVYGDESPRTPPRRADLVEVAMARWSARRGVPTDPREVVVIGDTPGDIECAKAHGCRVLAVATGKFSAGELAAHDPDLAVETLADTGFLAGWLLGRN